MEETTLLLTELKQLANLPCFHRLLDDHVAKLRSRRDRETNGAQLHRLLAAIDCLEEFRTLPQRMLEEEET